ncbi:MAG: spore coat protein CotJB [Eubacteriales bacterium]
MRMTEKDKLMRNVQATSFAMDDVILYLDSHPHDRNALNYYEKYKRMRNQAMEEYTSRFGPLNAYEVNVNNNSWAWVASPWPWEREE